ncbi:conjugal transfer protein TraD [Chryseobacterium chendengshani]|uniref:conjugal transfer protein TraD n=1 Tax=Chryseobacterium sp. LJ668 TaxID=2864040 RepID=UPI001C688972|nr:conjugal transfer protein TraD [Chryseobacterium sp. LJ668]MBW8523808.1 conjugal transfer protein TraD [Chryseobacterium sp. LJ668]QYK16751.1 conjugal transfer protein TraD [Chryseobacterium sp. LJ668]
MEILIVLCLLTVIALLLQDKIVIRKKSDEKISTSKSNPNVPEIIGLPKQGTNLFVQNRSAENFQNISVIPKDTDIEIDENKEFDIQTPSEKLDEIFSTQPDLEEEEEEWKKYGVIVEDDALALGATFDDLCTTGRILHKEVLQPFEKEMVINDLLKIQGTVLLEILQNSIEQGAVKIAELLDSSLSSSNTVIINSDNQKYGLDDFDIEKFV